MIRNDGTYQFYIIMTRSPGYRRGRWFTANLDHFGHPKGFSASDECWQKTGVNGTFDEKQARRGIRWMRKKHPNKQFALFHVLVSQQKAIVA